MTDDIYVPPPEDLFAGRYELRERLGRGAYGCVHRGYDHLHMKPVAIKLLQDSGNHSNLARAIWEEARQLRRARVPGVVGFVDEGRHREQSFVVMQLVDGTPFPGEEFEPLSSCDHTLEQEQALEVAQTFAHERGHDLPYDVLRERVVSLIRTLGRVHGLNMTHGDIKPQNILVDHVQRIPMVLDFGFASMVERSGGFQRSSSVHATPLFAAPELFRSQPNAPASDLWAVGVMAFTTLTGRFPFLGRNRVDLARNIFLTDAPSVLELNPHAPEDLAHWVDAMLTKDPEQRVRRVLELDVAPTAQPLRSLAWSGLERRVDEALRAGRSVFLTGARREDRELVLGHTTRRLEDDDIELVDLRLEERQGALDMCLGHSVFGVEPHPGESLDGLVQRIADKVIAYVSDEGVRRCVVLGESFVDDPTGHRLAAEIMKHGSLLTSCDAHRVPRHSEDVCIETVGQLEVEELMGLFDGPDIVVHARRRAARALFHRTGGYPAAIVQCLAAWGAHGLTSNTSGVYSTTPYMLDILEKGIFLGPHDERAWPDVTTLHDTIQRLLALSERVGRILPNEMVSAVLELPSYMLEAHRLEAQAMGLMFHADDTLFVTAPSELLKDARAHIDEGVSEHDAARACEVMTHEHQGFVPIVLARMSTTELIEWLVDFSDETTSDRSYTIIQEHWVSGYDLLLSSGATLNDRYAFVCAWCEQTVNHPIDEYDAALREVGELIRAMTRARTGSYDTELEHLGHVSEFFGMRRRVVVTSTALQFDDIERMNYPEGATWGRARTKLMAMSLRVLSLDQVDGMFERLREFVRQQFGGTSLLDAMEATVDAYHAKVLYGRSTNFLRMAVMNESAAPRRAGLRERNWTLDSA